MAISHKNKFRSKSLRQGIIDQSLLEAKSCSCVVKSHKDNPYSCTKPMNDIAAIRVVGQFITVIKFTGGCFIESSVCHHPLPYEFTVSSFIGTGIFKIKCLPTPGTAERKRELIIQ